MHNVISVAVLITLLLSLVGCAPTPKTAELELYNFSIQAETENTFLIGRVLYIDGGLGNEAPYLASASISMHRIPEYDKREAPRFDYDAYLNNKYEYEVLSGNTFVKRVDPGRYLVTPTIVHPFYLDDNNKIVHHDFGIIFGPFSDDYLGAISVQKDEAVYFGDILILKEDRFVLGVINNIDDARASLEYSFPGLAKRIEFRPFAGPHFMTLTKEQAAEISNNLGEHVRVKLLKYVSE